MQSRNYNNLNIPPHNLRIESSLNNTQKMLWLSGLAVILIVANDTFNIPDDSTNNRAQNYQYTAKAVAGLIWTTLCTAQSRNSKSHLYNTSLALYNTLPSLWNKSDMIAKRMITGALQACIASNSKFYSKFRQTIHIADASSALYKTIRLRSISPDVLLRLCRDVTVYHFPDNVPVNALLEGLRTGAQIFFQNYRAVLATNDHQGENPLQPEGINREIVNMRDNIAVQVAPIVPREWISVISGFTTMASAFAVSQLMCLAIGTSVSLGVLASLAVAAGLLGGLVGYFYAETILQKYNLVREIISPYFAWAKEELRLITDVLGITEILDNLSQDLKSFIEASLLQRNDEREEIRNVAQNGEIHLDQRERQSFIRRLFESKNGFELNFFRN